MPVSFKIIANANSFIKIIAGISLFSALSCNQKSESRQLNNDIKDTTAKSLEAMLTDSLFRYFYLTSFTQRSSLNDRGYVLHGVQLDSSKVGVLAIEGKEILLFQQFENHPLLTNKFVFTDHARDFAITDLNGDNRDDFIIYGSWDAHGNNYPYVFMSNSNHILQYRSDLHLPNISYDRDSKMVKSFWIGGAYDVHSKELYEWKNDSLKMVARAESDLTHEEMKPAETRLYKVQNGKEILYKRAKDEEQNIFDTALFKEEY